MDCPLTRKHDSLFMLDFASKYVVQNCDAPVGVGTGLMAVGVLAPLWLWALASAVHVAQGTKHTRVFSLGLSGATLLCWASLAWFGRAPPRPRVWAIRLVPLLTGGYCRVHHVRPRLVRLK